MANTQPTPMIITAAGLRVLAQGQTGLPINITRVSVGDAYLPPDTAVEEMAGLVSEVRDMPVNSKKMIGDGTVRIDTIVSNKGVTAPYFLREVGVWAVDNDTGGEILYSYANYGDAPIFIAADMGYHAVNFVHQVFIIIGRAANVSIVITEGYGYATQENIDDTVASLFRGPAPISRFWTADESEPRKLRPATLQDVRRALFDVGLDAPYLIGYDPASDLIFGYPLKPLSDESWLGVSCLGATYLTPPASGSDPNVSPAVLLANGGEESGVLQFENGSETDLLITH